MSSTLQTEPANQVFRNETLVSISDDREEQRPPGGGGRHNKWPTHACALPGLFVADKVTLNAVVLIPDSTFSGERARGRSCGTWRGEVADVSVCEVKNIGHCFKGYFYLSHPVFRSLSVWRNSSPEHPPAATSPKAASSSLPGFFRARTRDVTKLRRAPSAVGCWSPLKASTNMSSGQQWVLVEMVQAFYEVSRRLWWAGARTGNPPPLPGAAACFWVTTHPNTRRTL